MEIIPLSCDHCHQFAEVVQRGELWRLWCTSILQPDAMAAKIDCHLKRQAAGSSLPFTILDGLSSRPVGMTSYLHIDAVSLRVEIGSTWYAARFQRTMVNTEVRLLMSPHAFERLDCLAVEFRTHFLNSASCAAIERIGAKLDGVLHQQQRMQNDTTHDMCFYSITAPEWPVVQSHPTWPFDRPR